MHSRNNNSLAAVFSLLPSLIAISIDVLLYSCFEATSLLLVLMLLARSSTLVVVGMVAVVEMVVVVTV